MTTIEDIRVKPAVQKVYGIARKKIDKHQVKMDLIRFVFEHLRLRGVALIKLGEHAIGLGYPDIVFSVNGKGCALWIGEREYVPESKSVEMRKRMTPDWACIVLKSEQDFVKFMENK